jgi:hypothetical protein
VVGWLKPTTELIEQLEMKMIKVTIAKNVFNKAQFRKHAALTKLVSGLKYETMPADSGYCQHQVRTLFGTHSYYPDAPFANCVVAKRAGDPLTSGWIKVDPTRLTAEQVAHIERLIAPSAARPDVSVARAWFWERDVPFPA